MPNRYSKMYSIPVVITKLHTKATMRTSLVVQWMRTHHAEGTGSVPSLGRFHLLQSS